MHLDGSRERRGSSGRIGEKVADKHEPFERVNITLPKSLDERLEKYCYDDERAKSWAIQKALDEWLKKRDY